jgi:hypothetical protein
MSDGHCDSAYHRRPKARTRLPTWCIRALPNGSYCVRIWVPGAGGLVGRTAHVGNFASLDAALAARDAAQRELGLILK